MKKNINEAFVVSKGKDDRGNYIAYIDPSKPENKETFKYKDIFKKNGARWGGKYWFWYIGKTEDQWRKVYSSFIEPALKTVHKQENASEEDSKTALITSLDAIVSDIESIPVTSTGSEDGAITQEQKTETLNRLSKFKETLVNLDSDEEFKETMKTILAFKNAQGHQYSLINTLLIYLQNPKATFVMSEARWANYNRRIKPDAPFMLVRSPSKTAMRPYSAEEKENATNEYIKRLGKSNYNQLTIGEKDRLNVMLRGRFSGNKFDITKVYDVVDTIQIEGKEDYVSDIMKKRDVKWFEEGMVDEKVRPIHNALINFAKRLGINVSNVEDLGGARGVSYSGSIDTLKNEGNDVGLTKTLAHEIAHELLHQNYVKDKYSEYAKYFVGKEQGRELVEQQAELTAWMVMASFGFDLKTTSLNYVAIWGADKNAMVRVFDTVSHVTNLLIDEINKEISSTSVGEAEGDVNLQPAKHIEPNDIARVLGVESEYNQVLRTKNDLHEQFNKIINYKPKTIRG